MPNALDAASGQGRLSSLIAFALSEGWDVSRTECGRVVFSKDGLPPIFAGLSCNRDDDVRTRFPQRQADAVADQLGRGARDG